MSDSKQTDLVTAKTQKLPAVTTAEDDEKFRAEHERIKAMIAADAPLSEILSKLLLMIESESPAPRAGEARHTPRGSTDLMPPGFRHATPVAVA